jgi:CheY-like chemotaxis protein
MSVEQAVDRISKYVDQPAVRTSEESRRRIQDSLLAAEVGVALVKLGSGLQITASEGHVFIKINEYVVNLDRYKKKLKKFASEVPGVESVECAPGTGFVPPSLTRSFDPEIPSKILLVDDEPEFVQTLSERLQTRNLETSVAYGGEEALSLIATDEPEVMVLDLKMPGVDGMEVLRRVRRDHPNIEVIILTGHGSEKEREMARDLGAFAYLRKPVNIDELADVMKRAYQKVEARKKSKTKGE